MAVRINKKHVAVAEDAKNDSFIKTIEITGFKAPRKAGASMRQEFTFVNSKGEEARGELSAGLGYEDMLIPMATPVEDVRVAALRCNESFMNSKGEVVTRSIRFALQRDIKPTVMSEDDL